MRPEGGYVDLGYVACVTFELDTRGRQAYGFSAQIKLKSEIPV